MHDRSDRLKTRLDEWQRHLRALAPDDTDEGVVVVRPALIELLVDDLRRVRAALDAYATLAAAVRANVAEWTGSADALRQITGALDRLKEAEPAE